MEAGSKDARHHVWDNDERVPVAFSIFFESNVQILELCFIETSLLQFVSLDMSDFGIQVRKLIIINDSTRKDRDDTDQWFFQLFEQLLDLGRLKLSMVSFERVQKSFQIRNILVNDFMGLFFRSEVHLLCQEWKDQRLLCTKKIRK